MTGPDDSETSTRPISVAELLARNGTIGAAPPGGRRRRRRGNSDAVTVAELTGEIPIVRTGEIPIVEEAPEPVAVEAPAGVVAEEAVTETPEAEVPEPEAPASEPENPEADLEPDLASSNSASSNSASSNSESSNGESSNGESSNAESSNSEAGTAPAEIPPVTRPERADVPVARRGPVNRPERSRFPMVARKTTAETMSPDPMVDESPEPMDTDEPMDTEAQPDELGIGDGAYLQTYLRATSGPLFGGQTVADDLARRSGAADDSDLVIGDDLEVEEALDGEGPDKSGADKLGTDKRSVKGGDRADADRLSRGQLLVRGLLIAVQSIVAVAFGAGLFIAFDQLWKWNSIVALILGVLVILGLVVGVRVVRKTEDIGSTLTAVAVGALVTFGPLALLQAS